MDLKGIVESTDTAAGRLFDLIIQALIVLSLVSFAIATLPTLSDQARDLLDTIEVATVAVFTIEYLLRVAVANRRLRYIFSFFGIVDLVAILPFYVASGVDLRGVRVFRLLRLFRIFKFVRYSDAIRRFHRAFLIAREEIILFFCVACILMFVAAVGIYHFENPVQPETYASIFHSLWWAVVTLTTVGYGDIYPITTGGKVFTFVVLMIGLGVVSVPAGLVASALSEARRVESTEQGARGPAA